VTALEQLRLLTYGLVPATLLFCAISPGLVGVVYARGAFTSRATELTTAALDGFAVGIGTVGLSLVLVRMMLAVIPPMAVFRVTGIASVATVALAVPLTAVLGVFGTTLAIAAGGVVSVYLQVARLGAVFGRPWRRAAMAAAAVPVTALTALSFALVVLEREGPLDVELRAAVLLTACTAAVAVAARRLRTTGSAA